MNYPRRIILLLSSTLYLDLKERERRFNIFKSVDIIVVARPLDRSGQEGIKM